MGLTFRLGQVPLAIFTDTSNNVGIGAAASGSYKLQVTGTTNLTGALSGTSATFSSSVTAESVTQDSSLVQQWVYKSATTAYRLQLNTIVSSNLVRYSFDLTNNSTAFPNNLVLDRGNVGIGTPSPSVKLQVNQSSSFDGIRILSSNATTQNTLSLYHDDNKAVIETTYLGSGAFKNLCLNTQGGNVLIGRTTSGLNNTEGVTISSGSIQPEGNSYVFYGNRTTSDGLFMGIRRNNVDVGSITVTTSATAFNTSSDYRLKQDLKEFNGLSIINSIKTYDYEWKIDSTRAYGVIAHELEEILPYAVFGKKDEINENGNIKPQAVDYSKLVPILIKSIQELEARIKQLENK